MVSMTIGNLRQIHGLSRDNITNARFDTVKQDIIGNEVYAKSEIVELLKQPHTIAIRPLNLSYDGSNHTILVGVKEMAGDVGEEYIPMLEDENLVVLPRLDTSSHK